MSSTPTNKFLEGLLSDFERPEDKMTLGEVAMTIMMVPLVYIVIVGMLCL